jgi:hypothetical protein
MYVAGEDISHEILNYTLCLVFSPNSLNLIVFKSPRKPKL